MNNLWKPEGIAQPKVRVVKPPKRGPDRSICEPCQHKGKCVMPGCPPVQWVDGHAGGKEPLMSQIDINMEHYQSADYKESLADHAAFFDREGTGEAIRGMKTGRPKAIAALLFFGFLKQDVKRYLHIPHSSFYEIVRRGRGK